MSRAGCPSGVRLRFATTSPWVTVRMRPCNPDEIAPADRFVADLTADGVLLDSREVTDGRYRVDLEPAGGSAATATGVPVYEIWLSPYHATVIDSVEVEDGSVFGIPSDDRTRWITYGSSITMCRQAYSPARTWPATAARRLVLNLTSLGFGGQCHLDPMVARVMRDLPADVITLKLGINIYGGATLGARTYPAAVIGFVRTIRDGHPRTPIGVITAIPSPPREREPNAAGCTLEDYRAMTRDAVARLQAAGDDRLRLFEGTELFGEEDAHLLPDDLHPNGEGYELMGVRAAERVLPRLLRDRDVIAP